MSNRRQKNAPTTNARRSARSFPESGAVAAAVRFLARRDRSSSQVRDHLIAGGHSKTAVQRAIHILQRLRYLDDEAAAARLARTRLARRPMGVERLSVELKNQGFSDETVNAAVNMAYGGITEASLAKHLLESLSVKYTDPRREARRRAALLNTRGFSEDLIETLVVIKCSGQD